MIGPVFVERTSTGVVYLDMLEQYISPQVEQIGQENNINVIFY